MAVKLSEKQKALVDAKNFAHVATLNEDGSPQNSPVWVEMDGDDVLINSETTRLKVRNLRRDPRVSLSVLNMENPYQYVEIRGRVKEVTPTGGFEGIDRLSAKYVGQPNYQGNRPGDVRVVIRIEPLHVTGMNV